MSCREGGEERGGVGRCLDVLRGGRGECVTLELP